MITVTRTESERTADSLTRVLASAGIASHAIERAGVWDIEVDDDDLRHAVEVLREIESPPSTDRPSSPPPRWSQAGLAFAALLAVAHILALTGDHRAVIRQAGTSGYLVARGEVYRALTSLFVHADLQHLLGNLVAMGILGSAVAAAAGPGVAAGLLLGAGTLGNLLSGAVRHSTHLSIGASTAVFAAVGILAVRQFFERRRMPAQRLRAWVPLAAALALLSMLGSAPETDLIAHLFGLFSGMAVGSVYVLVMPGAAGRVVQLLTAAMAAAVTGVAWRAALRG